MNFHFGFWDLLLIVVVSVQATVLAYLHHPRWKALALTLPFPFTVATLAVDQPLDATNVLGLILLAVFTNGVRVLHQNFRMPIVPAIGIAALGYCLIGWMVVGIVPRNDAVFWGSCIVTFAIAVILLKITPHRDEPGHRSLLRVWIKLPIIMAVVCGLILIKQGLRGFTTVFPMVGVVAAYEARHSLWTMSRQIPMATLAMVPMMIACRLAQDPLGLPAALALGWIAFGGTLLPLTRSNRLKMKVTNEIF